MEISCRFYEVYEKKALQKMLKYPDYGDVNGDNDYGSNLKPNFNGMVRGAYLNPVKWINNSKGFRSDREFTQTPPKGVFRILSLGDSFTAGYRVEQGNTYSDLIQKWASKSIIKSEVMIAQIELPYNGLKYLKKYGWKMKPHMLLLGVTIGNDISQDFISLSRVSIGFRKVLDKYNLPNSCFNWENGKIVIGKQWYKDNPFGKYFHFLKYFLKHGDATVASYGRAYPKMFDACHGLGMFIKDTPSIVHKAYQRHFNVLSQFKEFCDAKNIEFVVLLFPQRFQVQEEDWEATKIYYSLKKEAFDLNLPNKLIKGFCKKVKISCIDATKFMKNAHNKKGVNMYCSKSDMHWNQKGHKYLFLGAKKELEPLIKTSIAKHKLK